MLLCVSMLCLTPDLTRSQKHHKMVNIITEQNYTHCSQQMCFFVFVFFICLCKFRDVCEVCVCACVHACSAFSECCFLSVALCCACVGTVLRSLLHNLSWCLCGIGWEREVLVLHKGKEYVGDGVQYTPLTYVTHSFILSQMSQWAISGEKW